MSLCCAQAAGQSEVMLLLADIQLGDSAPFRLTPTQERWMTQIMFCCAQVAGQSNVVLSLADIQLGNNAPWAGLAEQAIANASSSPSPLIRMYQVTVTEL